MTGQERQVLHVMPAWVRRLYLALGLAYLALGAVRAVQEPSEWRGWVNLALAVVWLLGARAVSLAWVVTPTGVLRERFTGGHAEVPWAAVDHVGHDAQTPAFRTGGQLRLADGREVTFRRWSDDGVRRARAWWEAAREGGADAD